VIKGLRDRAAFKATTKSKSAFGGRPALLTAIGDAIDEAHNTSGRFFECRALVKIRLACQSWLNAHPDKKYISQIGIYLVVQDQSG
jgi:hypothetical protein